MADQINLAELLVDSQTALNTLVNQVRRPVLQSKLASVGLPATDAEGMEETIMLLKAAKAQQKPSAPFSKMAGDIKKHLGLSQVDSEVEYAVKSAAAHLMQNPNVYRATLSLLVAEQAQANAMAS